MNRVSGIVQAEFCEKESRAYFPALTQIPLLEDNLTGCLLVTELEYLFEKHPNGFLAFYDRQPENPDYMKGQSWEEKLSISPGDFRLEFDKFGIRYDSYKKFKSETDKFKGKYYCSFYDASRKQSFFLRNNPVMDKWKREIFEQLTLTEIFADFPETLAESLKRLHDEFPPELRRELAQLDSNELRDFLMSREKGGQTVDKE